MKHFEFLWRLSMHAPLISIACSHSNLSFLVKSSPKKRLPHGATLLLVEGAAALLARAAGEEIPITRQELHAKLTPANLSSDTIDDRIRVLVQRGQLVQVGHGAYAMPGGPLARKAATGWRWSVALGRWSRAAKNRRSMSPPAPAAPKKSKRANSPHQTPPEPPAPKPERVPNTSQVQLPPAVPQLSPAPPLAPAPMFDFAQAKARKRRK